MTNDKFLSIYQSISDKEPVTNEVLFEALRFCEKKVEKVKNKEIWSERITCIKNLIVTQNMGCVYACLGKFKRRYDPECLDEALYAVSCAMRYYDFKRGFKWVTYLVYAVRRQINRYLKTRGTKHISLDPSYLFARETPDFTEISSLREVLDRNLARLTDEEMDILRCRFWENKFLHKVAETKGISYEWVRILQNRALSKLRSYFTESEISLTDLDARLDLFDLKIPEPKEEAA